MSSLTVARRLMAVLGAMVFVLLLAPPAEAAAPTSAPTPAPDAAHPVVVIGVDGLRWDQVGAGTPTLDALARSSATGLLAARGADEKTSTLDAWATLSAGNRARARDLPAPTATADPGVAVAQRQTSPARTGAHVGALADALGPRCVTAVGGRGATLAAARSDGRLAVPPAASGCPVVLVSEPTPAAADLAVRQWQSRAARLIVVGLGDTDVPTHLHTVVSADRSGTAPGELVSGSTRRAPYVQLVDVAPTVLEAFGVRPPATMIGEPWRVTGAAPSRAGFLEADRRARFMPTAVVGVVVPLVVAFVPVLVLAVLLCWRGRRELGWAVALWDCRLTAAAPLATFLARLFPYERWGLAGLWVLILALDAAVLAVTRARIGWVAAATAAVLTLDVVAGAPLQLHSVLGYSALVAGRFAGLGNPAFGAFAAAVLVTAIWLARPLPVAAVGLAAVVVDGAPMLGSDVGGVLALVPAFALLVWSLSGRRIRVRTVLLAGGAAIAVLVLFAAADLTRDPASRTHLGRFAADLLSGRAGETLSRKAAANWALLTRNAATLLVLPVMAALAVVLARAPRWVVTRPLARALEAEPALRPGLVACLIAGTIGFAVNDSGVVVPAVMLLIAVPAAIEAAARHRTAAAAEDGIGIGVKPLRRVAPAGQRPDVP